MGSPLSSAIRAWWARRSGRRQPTAGLGLLLSMTCVLAVGAGRPPEEASLAPGRDHPAGASARQPGTDQSNWFAFSLPWDDAAPTWIDASDLLLEGLAPGGEPETLVDSRGRVRANAEGHLEFTNTGERVRFWGTNLAFSAGFPPCPDFPPQGNEFPDANAAAKLAARLAKLGFNAVRLHHIDHGKRPLGIWLNPAADTQELDAVQLGRLDCLIGELKKHGIYVDLNLHVSREFTQDDGVTQAGAFEGTRANYNKGATLFDPVMIALQQRYAAQLLGHVNPYTGLSYAADPVILATETTSEDSFFISLAMDALNHDPADAASFPEFYSRELDGWTQIAGTGPTTNRLLNPGFETGLDGWFGYVHGDAWAILEPVAESLEGAQALRVEVSDGGSERWQVQFGQADLSLLAGEAYRLRFAVRADQPTTIRGTVMRNELPWDALGWAGEIAVTSEWVTHTVDFTATATVFGDARVSFDVGGAARTFWFDAFRFSEADAFPGWLGWLEEHYGSTAALAAAWAPANPLPESIDNVSLRSADPAGLLPGESLETNRVARLRRTEAGRFTPQRVQDTFRFYYDTEAEYFRQMQAAIQDRLGSRSLNTGTASWAAALPDIRAMSPLDFVDGHWYWDHPEWPDAEPWSPTGWVIQNEPWVNHPFAGLFDLAVSAVQGKPFTVTEFNEPFPNRYAAEGPLLMASLANLQDWDAVFLFAYTHDQNHYGAQQATGFFDQAGNPVATGLMPIAARLFLGAQTAPAPDLAYLDFTEEETLSAVGGSWGDSAAGFLQEQKGVAPAAAFGQRLRIAGFSAAAPVTPTIAAPPGPVYRSGGGQLTWDLSDPERGLYTVDAPEVQAVTGFLAGRTIRLANVELAFPADTAPFGAVVLQSRDGQPINLADQLLLGVFTRVENSGMEWNEEGTSLEDRWGVAPALVEPIQCTVTVSQSEAVAALPLEVWALDQAGAFRYRLAQQDLALGQIRFAVDTRLARTLWFALRRERVRAVCLPVVLH